MKMGRGLRKYWSRKGYERLDAGGGGSGFRRKINQVELGAKLGASSDGAQKKKWCWRIKITPKIRLFLKRSSPKKILIRLRDAYVNMMLGFANSRVFNSGFGGAVGAGGGGGFANSVGAAGYGFGKPVLKEYDEKVIVEFYKSLMAQGRLMPRDAARIVDDGLVICRRPLH